MQVDFRTYDNLPCIVNYNASKSKAVSVQNDRGRAIHVKFHLRNNQVEFANPGGGANIPNADVLVPRGIAADGYVSPEWVSPKGPMMSRVISVKTAQNAAIFREAGIVWAEQKAPASYVVGAPATDPNNGDHLKNLAM